jgi:arabinan endo-1,5-alpha-L-arabinosidase
MGTKLANSYIFTAKDPHVAPHTDQDWTWGGFRGPGHGVPFYDDSTNDYYFVHHVRDGAPQLCETWPRVLYKMHYLVIRKMEFVDGWPVLSPEPYAGEDNGEIAQDCLYGEWETIMQTSESNQPKLPQKSVLLQDGNYCCPQNQNGTWSYCEQSNMLNIVFSDGTTVCAKMLKCWDFENGNPTICCTGMSNKGVAYWSKLVDI